MCSSSGDHVLMDAIVNRNGVICGQKEFCLMSKFLLEYLECVLFLHLTQWGFVKSLGYISESLFLNVCQRKDRNHKFCHPENCVSLGFAFQFQCPSKITHDSHFTQVFRWVEAYSPYHYQLFTRLNSLKNIYITPASLLGSTLKHQV